MNHIAAFAAGILAGATIGVLAGLAFGRHDDRGLMPWWLGVGV